MTFVIDKLLADVCAWAAERGEIRAVALVGSHARGVPRPDSDVDLVILTERPRDLLEDLGWTVTFGTVDRSLREDWGRVTSVRVWYAAGPEVEFGVTTPDWALVPDEGTLRVVRDGLRVLFDRGETFATLAQA